MANNIKENNINFFKYVRSRKPAKEAFGLLGVGSGRRGDKWELIRRLERN